MYVLVGQTVLEELIKIQTNKKARDIDKNSKSLHILLLNKVKIALNIGMTKMKCTSLPDEFLVRE